MVALFRQWWADVRGVLSARDNPFLLRELCRSRRRQRVLQPLLWALIAYAFAFGMGALVGAALGEGGISTWWGGSAGGLCTITLAWAHLAAAAVAAARLGGDWTTQEHNQGTLALLLVTPLSARTMATARAAVPWLAGTITGLGALPFYVAAMWLGGPGPGVLLGIYIVVGALLVLVSRSAPTPPGHLAARQVEPAPTSFSGGLSGLGWVALALVTAALCAVPLRFATSSPVNPLALPVQAAAWLVGVQPFYGLWLPPLAAAAVLLPLWLVRATTAWGHRLAPTWSAAVAYTRLRALIWTALLFLGLGFIWPHMRASPNWWGLAWPGALAQDPLRLAFLALLGWTVVGAALEAQYGWPLSTGVAMLAWRWPPRGAGKSPGVWSDLANTLSALCLPIGLLLAGCLLSRTSPLAVGTAFAAKAVLVAAAALAYVHAARLAWPLGCLLLLTVPLPLLGIWRDRISFDLMYPAALSPLAGLLGFVNLPPWLVGSPWWLAGPLQLSIGLGVALRAHVRAARMPEWQSAEGFHQARLAEQCASHEADAEHEPWEEEHYVTETQPTRAPGRPFVPGPVWRLAFAVQRYYDNPVMADELRRGFGPSTWGCLIGPMPVLGLGFLGLLVSLLRSGTSFGLPVAGLEFTVSLAPWRAMLIAWAVGMMLYACALAFILPASVAVAGLPRRFEKGQLADLILTGMDSRSVIFGLAAGGLWPFLLCLLPLAALALLGALASLSPLGILAALVSTVQAFSVAVLSTGTALAGAGAVGFLRRSQTVGAVLAAAAVVVLGLVQIGLAHVVGQVGGWVGDLLAQVVYLAGAVGQGAIGWAGLRAAASSLRRLSSQDLPVPDAAWPAPKRGDGGNRTGRQSVL